MCRVDGSGASTAETRGSKGSSGWDGAAIHRASRGSYGRPRIVRQLRAQGHSASAECVRRSLQRQGLRPVYKRPYRVTTDSTHHLLVAPNPLDRRFDGCATAPI